MYKALTFSLRINILTLRVSNQYVIGVYYKHLDTKCH